MEKRTPSKEGRELRALRIALDYSQDEMAYALNIRVRRLQLYEGGGTQRVPAAVLDRARTLKKKSA